MVPPSSTVRRRPPPSRVLVFAFLAALLSAGPTGVAGLSFYQEPSPSTGQRSGRFGSDLAPSAAIAPEQAPVRLDGQVFQNLVVRRSAYRSEDEPLVASAAAPDGLTVAERDVTGDGPAAAGEAKVSVKRTFSEHIRLKQQARRERRRLQASTGPPSLTRRAWAAIVGKTTLFNGNRLGKRTQDIPGSEVPDSRVGGAGSEHEAEEELYKVVPEANGVHLAFSIISVFIVIFALFSAFIKETLYAGEAIIAVVVGIAFGPYGADLFDPRGWDDGRQFNEYTLEFTRVVIALSVFAVGVELPRAYMKRHARSLSFLLGPIMLFGWLVVGAFMYILVPKIGFLAALVAAAASTPTDPILAASVVGKGKYAQEHVPAHLRHMLQAESGSNDGAAFPFLYLAMFLLLRGAHSVGDAIGYWIALVVLYQIVLGTFIGAIIGVAARKLMKFCKRHSTIDRESMVAMYVALALLTTGLTTLAGSDDLLAAFACGTAFAWDDWFTESIEESNFSNIIDLLINCTTFIYIGATMPFDAWNDPDLSLKPWRLATLAIAIILLRRFPAMFAFARWIKDIKTPREAVFCGHFGPIGVGAIFISTLAATKLPTPSIPPENELDVLGLIVQPVTYCLVLCSVLVHGLSIPFFSLGRSMHSRVHSMTRTWTQASNQEPSWLSRVKRAGDVVVPTAPAVIIEEKEKGSSPSSSDKDLAKLEKGDSTASDEKKAYAAARGRSDSATVVIPPQIGFPDTSARQRELERQILGEADEGEAGEAEAPEAGGSGGSNEEADIAGEDTLAALRPTVSRTSMSEKRPGFGLRPSFLRIPTATKRTSEEEAAWQKEKLERDAWCRRERRDNPRKNEERIYVSGRHIIVERGAGDEVEVREVDPSSESAQKAKTDPNLRLVKISSSKLDTETEAVKKEDTSLEGQAAAAYKAAKRLVARRFSLAGGESPFMPGPGMGPKAHDVPLEEEEDDDEEAAEQSGKGKGRARRHTEGAHSRSQYEERRRLQQDKEGIHDRTDDKGGHEAHYDDRCERRWIEGDKLVVERDDGETVKVYKLTDDQVRDYHDHHRRHGGEAGTAFLHSLTPTAESMVHEGESLRDRLSPAFTKMLFAGRDDDHDHPKRRSMESRRSRKSAEESRPTTPSRPPAGSTSRPSSRPPSRPSSRPSSPKRSHEGGHQRPGSPKHLLEAMFKRPGSPKHREHHPVEHAAPPVVHEQPKHGEAAHGEATHGEVQHGHEDGEWIDHEESPDNEHEASSASSARPRTRSLSFTARRRSGSRASQPSPRPGRRSRSPSKPRERKVSETQSSSPDDSSPADDEPDRSRSTHRRIGSGLLLAPGSGVGFGTTGHYSRSSSPSRSIRFAPQNAPERAAEAANVKKPKRKSRLGFSSLQRSISQRRDGPDAGASGSGSAAQQK